MTIRVKSAGRREPRMSKSCVCAMENAPAVAPLASGISTFDQHRLAFQVYGLIASSTGRQKNDGWEPPVTKAVTNSGSSIINSELLAAKARVSEDTSSPSNRFRVQFAPPWWPYQTAIAPLTGSPRIHPLERSENWSASQKPSGSGLVKRRVQVWQASVVL